MIGAGNTAMDAMRVSLRAWRREGLLRLSAQRDRGAGAGRGDPSREEEGVEFHWLTSPVEIARTMAKASSAPCAACGWSSASPTIPAAGARAGAGSEFEFETDTVVFAIGTNANPIIGQTSQLKLNKRGYIETDDDLATSMAGVFAGGDIVTGAATVIEAMGAGRKAARSMKTYLGMRDFEVASAKPIRHSSSESTWRNSNFARIRVATPRGNLSSADRSCTAR